MKYDCVIIFKKVTNLMPYLKAYMGDSKMSAESKKRYASERIVRLVLLVRYEHDRTEGKLKTFCKIKCPINPFPVKGEFEAPSMNAVKYALIDHGWIETEAIAGFMIE